MLNPHNLIPKPTTSKTRSNKSNRNNQTQVTHRKQIKTQNTNSKTRNLQHTNSKQNQNNSTVQLYHTTPIQTSKTLIHKSKTNTIPKSPKPRNAKPKQTHPTKTKIKQINHPSSQQTSKFNQIQPTNQNGSK